MIKKKNSYFYLLLFLFAGPLLSGCQNKEQVQKAKEIIPVKVTRIAFKDLSETIDYVGNIKAKEEAIIYPKVSGKVIEKLKEDGSLVKKNDIIAYIDRDEVGLKFEKAPVESPLAGIIGRVYVDIGENVTTQTPIALVVDMEKMEIDLDVPEKYLAQVSLGQVAKMSVDTYPQEEFIGTVTKISPILDLATRAAPIEITVDNKDHRLRSGMFAKVSLVIAEHKNIPVIIKEAIMGKDPNCYVYIIEGNKAVLKKISLGIHQATDYEIKEGLKEGELVVIMGQQRLYNGAEVSTEE